MLLHIGFVMSKIDELSAMESLRLYDEILKAMQEEDEALLNANGGVRE